MTTKSKRMLRGGLKNKKLKGTKISSLRKFEKRLKNKRTRNLRGGATQSPDGHFRFRPQRPHDDDEENCDQCFNFMAESVGAVGAAVGEVVGEVVKWVKGKQKKN